MCAPVKYATPIISFRILQLQSYPKMVTDYH